MFRAASFDIVQVTIAYVLASVDAIDWTAWIDRASGYALLVGFAYWIIRHELPRRERQYDKMLEKHDVGMQSLQSKHDVAMESQQRRFDEILARQEQRFLTMLDKQEARFTRALEDQRERWCEAIEAHTDAVREVKSELVHLRSLNGSDNEGR